MPAILGTARTARVFGCRTLFRAKVRSPRTSWASGAFARSQSSKGADFAFCFFGCPTPCSQGWVRAFVSCSSGRPPKRCRRRRRPEAFRLWFCGCRPSRQRKQGWRVKRSRVRILPLLFRVPHLRILKVGPCFSGCPTPRSQGWVCSPFVAPASSRLFAFAFSWVPHPSVPRVRILTSILRATKSHLRSSRPQRNRKSR